ncbi:MAG: hypothetical protein PF693_15825 [Spirochaetia bacterium]|jgi:hypothetical protein|nr:hypothetical protein [Spirochaetia bacterium]
MKKIIFLLVILIVISTAAVPLFAGVSIDLGVSALGNANYMTSRPLGAIAAIGVTLFDNKAIMQIVGGFFSPTLNGSDSYPAGAISAGVLFSPMEYLYLGFRTGMITLLDDKDSDVNSYGSMVLRVQKPGKGIHYFAETEVSLLGNFNRFSMGVNFTL